MNKYIMIAIVAVLIGAVYIYVNQTVDFEYINYNNFEAEKAYEDLQFTIKRSSYIPEKFRLGGAIIYTLDGKHRMIHLRYFDDENRIGFEVYGSLKDLEVMSLDNTLQWEEVKVNQTQAYIGHSAYRTEIVWMDEGILYTISSYTLSEEELFKIAESFQ